MYIYCTSPCMYFTVSFTFQTCSLTRLLLMSWRYSCHVVGSDRRRLVLRGTWRRTGFLKVRLHHKALKPPHVHMCLEYQVPVHAKIKLKPSSQSMFCQWLLMNLKTGSKSNISPILYNIIMILTTLKYLPFPQFVKLAESRSYYYNRLPQWYLNLSEFNTYVKNQNVVLQSFLWLNSLTMYNTALALGSAMFKLDVMPRMWE